MMAISQKLTIDSPNLFHVNSSEQFLKTRAELYETFKTHRYSEKVSDEDFEEMCNNTLWVADRCETFKPDTSLKIPSFEEDVKKLRYLVAKGLKERGFDKCTKKYVVDNKSVTYLEQTKIELERILEKGFASYFMITQDLIKWGQSQGWCFGPRGSVGGSLVCYLLGISSINPMVRGLSFDRFLSQSRGGYILNIKAE
jgi:DNA polymerase-3 subunit alpha